MYNHLRIQKKTRFVILKTLFNEKEEEKEKERRTRDRIADKSDLILGKIEPNRSEEETKMFS